MKNLYLFHYHGGTCGDFICLEVSKDDNFYTNDLLLRSDTNRWLGINPLTEFKLDYKENITSVSKEVYEQIDKKFQEKNLIIPAHNVRRNLPRLKIVRSYVEDKRYAPLFYIMLFLKALQYKRYLSDNQEAFSQLGHTHSFHQMYKIYKTDYSKFNNSKGNELIKVIEERGYYYNFELRALELNLCHMKELIKEHYPMYFRRLMQEFPADVKLPVDKLLYNPKDYVGEFSKSIGMAHTLSPAIIEQYHQTNLDVIERTFNKSYDDLVKVDWQDELQEYINQTCPDNWFSQTSQQP